MLPFKRWRNQRDTQKQLLPSECTRRSRARLYIVHYPEVVGNVVLKNQAGTVSNHCTLSRGGGEGYTQESSWYSQQSLYIIQRWWGMVYSRIKLVQSAIIVHYPEVVGNGILKNQAGTVSNHCTLSRGGGECYTQESSWYSQQSLYIIQRWWGMVYSRIKLVQSAIIVHYPEVVGNVVLKNQAGTVSNHCTLSRGGGEWYTQESSWYSQQSLYIIQRWWGMLYSRIKLVQSAIIVHYPEVVGNGILKNQAGTVSNHCTLSRGGGECCTQESSWYSQQSLYIIQRWWGMVYSRIKLVQSAIIVHYPEVVGNVVLKNQAGTVSNHCTLSRGGGECCTQESSWYSQQSLYIIQRWWGMVYSRIKLVQSAIIVHYPEVVGNVVLKNQAGTVSNHCTLSRGGGECCTQESSWYSQQSLYIIQRWWGMVYSRIKLVQSAIIVHYPGVVGNVVLKNQAGTVSNHCTLSRGGGEWYTQESSWYSQQSLYIIQRWWGMLYSRIKLVQSAIIVHYPEVVGNVVLKNQAGTVSNHCTLSRGGGECYTQESSWYSQQSLYIIQRWWGMLYSRIKLVQSAIIVHYPEVVGNVVLKNQAGTVSNHCTLSRGGGECCTQESSWYSQQSLYIIQRWWGMLYSRIKLVQSAIIVHYPEVVGNVVLKNQAGTVSNHCTLSRGGGECCTQESSWYSQQSLYIIQRWWGMLYSRIKLVQSAIIVHYPEVVGNGILKNQAGTVSNHCTLSRGGGECYTQESSWYSQQSLYIIQRWWGMLYSRIKLVQSAIIVHYPEVVGNGILKNQAGTVSNHCTLSRGGGECYTQESSWYSQQSLYIIQRWWGMLYSRIKLVQSAIIVHYPEVVGNVILKNQAGTVSNHCTLSRGGGEWYTQESSWYSQQSLYIIQRWWGMLYSRIKLVQSAIIVHYPEVVGNVVLKNQAGTVSNHCTLSRGGGEWYTQESSWYSQQSLYIIQRWWGMLYSRIKLVQSAIIVHYPEVVGNGILKNQAGTVSNHCTLSRGGGEWYTQESSWYSQQSLYIIQRWWGMLYSRIKLVQSAIIVHYPEVVGNVVLKNQAGTVSNHCTLSRGGGECYTQESSWYSQQSLYIIQRWWGMLYSRIKLVQSAIIVHYPEVVGNVVLKNQAGTVSNHCTLSRGGGECYTQESSWYSQQSLYIIQRWWGMLYSRIKLVQSAIIVHYPEVVGNVVLKNQAGTVSNHCTLSRGGGECCTQESSWYSQQSLYIIQRWWGMLYSRIKLVQSAIIVHYPEVVGNVVLKNQAGTVSNHCTLSRGGGEWYTQESSWYSQQSLYIIQRWWGMVYSRIKLVQSAIIVHYPEVVGNVVLKNQAGTVSNHCTLSRGGGECCTQESSWYSQQSLYIIQRWWGMVYSRIKLVQSAIIVHYPEVVGNVVLKNQAGTVSNHCTLSRGGGEWYTQESSWYSQQSLYIIQRWWGMLYSRIKLVQSAIIVHYPEVVGNGILKNQAGTVSNHCTLSRGGGECCTQESSWYSQQSLYIIQRWWGMLYSRIKLVQSAIIVHYPEVVGNGILKNQAGTVSNLKIIPSFQFEGHNGKKNCKTSFN